ncbi:MAG: putative DNA binding domain-containing protein [Clostridiales bacterium]|jgi:ATP-dependent DNA helicase RecG|nr:putative DNA binding domain-containing protein [Clostridiales bacterium]
MQEHELVELVGKITSRKFETQTIEVKAAHKGIPQFLYDTLSSFSNQDEGGTMVFGIDEKTGYKIVGVYNAQDFTQKFASACKSMTPAVRAILTTVVIDGMEIVSAEIPGVDISERPVFYNGAGRIRGSYIRVGEADEPMTEYEVYSLDAYKRHVKEDARIVDGAKRSDLDDIKVASLLLKAKTDKPQFGRLPDDEILERLGVLSDGVPTVAGLFTVGKYPQQFFPQLSVTAVVVPGTEVGQVGSEGERFLANKRFDGTIDEMLEQARLFIARNIRVKTIIENGNRVDKEEYPLNSVREAVLNGLMHRDYSVRAEDTPVQLKLFYDRLEITSPGGLYGRITIKSLGQGRADTRNATLANIMEIMGSAENRFSGIPTIRREFKDAELPAPEFINRRGDFTVIFYNGQSEKTAKIKQELAAPITAVSADERIAQYCKISRSRIEIADFIGVTQYYAVKTYIEPLVAKGVLKLTLPNTPKSKYQRYISE